MPEQIVQITKLDTHILALNIGAWGHTVASINLVVKLVRCRPVYVTIAVVDTLYDKTVAMLDGLFTKGVAMEEALRALIRVAGSAQENEPEIAPSYREIFKSSYEMAPIPVHSGKPDVLPIVPKPKLVLADFLLMTSLHAIREIAAASVKVFAVQSSSPAFMLRLGPVEEGKPGMGDLSKMFAAIDAEGLAQEEADAKIDKVYRRQDGAVFYHAGLPPVYDYELLPQKPTSKFSVATVLQWAHEFLMDCDGVVNGTSNILEKDAVAEFARVFKIKPEMSVCAGPFAFPLKPITWDVDVSSAADVRALLDKALKVKGPNSVIYISLGSAHWTVEPEKMWAIISILLDRGIYLLFSHASRHAVIPEDLKARLDASETAFASTWMPQTQILEHEACGWFLTHCGENSYCEALSAGVPVICMPLSADQPYNAIYATDVHCVGYELYNARNGPGLGPIHRKNDWAPEGTVEALKTEFEEILDTMFGEDGDAKRMSARKYQALLQESWKEGGESWKEIEKLLKHAI